MTPYVQIGNHLINNAEQSPGVSPGNTSAVLEVLVASVSGCIAPVSLGIDAASMLSVWFAKLIPAGTDESIDRSSV